jgi:hypothetical protein
VLKEPKVPEDLKGRKDFRVLSDHKAHKGQEDLKEVMGLKELRVL